MQALQIGSKYGSSLYVTYVGYQFGIDWIIWYVFVSQVIPAECLSTTYKKHFVLIKVDVKFITVEKLYYMVVLLNVFLFRSPLPSIAAFPFILLWMHGRFDNNYGTWNVHCIMRQRYVLYFIHSRLTSKQQIGYDLQTWFDCRFNSAKCFSLRHHMHYLKWGKKSFFA